MKGTIHELDGFFNRFFAEKVDDIADKGAEVLTANKRGLSQSLRKDEPFCDPAP